MTTMTHLLLIATHDSATGERPASLLSWLLIPFCRTQSKTIKQQYDSGCTMFDIRIRKYRGQWHCAHGLFITKKTFAEVLREINNFPEPCYLGVTYEGRLADQQATEDFIRYVKACQAETPNILWGDTAVKYTDRDAIVDWSVILPATCASPRTIQGFLPLDGRTWHTYLPIPWLWKKLYHNHPTFTTYAYTYVDFL